MSDDLIQIAKYALSDMQGRVDASKLAVFAECIDHIEELEATLKIAMKALTRLSTAECHGNGEALGIDMSKFPLGREILARMEYASNALIKIKGDQI